MGGSGLEFEANDIIFKTNLRSSIVSKSRSSFPTLPRAPFCKTGYEICGAWGKIKMWGLLFKNY